MTGTAPELIISPRAGHLGVDVHGIDLREPLSPELRSDLRHLLDRHLVVFFPGQELDDAGQLAFALQFGAPYVHPIGRVLGRTGAGCERIVDDAEHPPYQDKWHTDVSWDPTPPVYGTLRAIDLPPRGGDTIWASMYAAYDTLSPLMQRAIEPLQARHTVGSMKAFISKAGAEVMARVAEQFSGSVQPVVGVHPSTGRKYLNVNAEFTESIVDLTSAESTAMLRFLTDHATNPNFQVRHSWSVGDVAIWDERTTQHFAVADYQPARREMGRVAVV